MLTLFLLLYVYGGDDYLLNLKVVSKTTKCRDFTVIFTVFQKCTVILLIFYRDFLTALCMSIPLQRRHWSIMRMLTPLLFGIGCSLSSTTADARISLVHRSSAAGSEVCGAACILLWLGSPEGR